MQSMLTLNGVLVNTFVSPGGVSKKTGESFEARDKIQLLCDIPLQDGGTRKDLVSMTVESAADYRGREGEVMSLPVGTYASGRSVGFFVLRGITI